MGIGAVNSVNSNGNLVLQNSTAKSAQSATPTFANNKTWNSIGDMEQAFRNYAKEWRGAYTSSFASAGAEGNGKITQDELNELLQAEFAGVNFTDGPIDIENPKEGKYEVYIDQANRQKMADDPEYRAKVFAVIQTEMASSNGYSVQTAGGVIKDRTTGLSMSIAEGNPLYEGVPHSAGGTSASKGVMFSTSSTGSTKEKKSILEQILEDLEEKLEEKMEQERREAAKKPTQDILELSVEAKAKIKSTEKTDSIDGKPTIATDPENTDGIVDVLA
jgi:hypothetical protein